MREPRPVPVWACALFALASACAAVVVDLSAAHAEHHSDSLIPVLASLYHWEPYFWGSDRNGQLVSLLAVPWSDPFTSLLVQFGLSVFAGLIALGAFARLLSPRCCPAVAAGAWALLLLGCCDSVRFNLFHPGQPYAVSMLCAGIGLWAVSGPALRPWRWAQAAALFVLAGWVNVGMGLTLGPWLLFGRLFAGRAGVGGCPPPYLRGLVLLAWGTVVGMGLQRLSPFPGAGYGLLPPAQWAPGALRVAHDLVHNCGFNLALVAGLLALGLVWARVPATRASAVRHLRGGCAALAALALSFGLAGANAWVAKNGYAYRYLFSSLMLVNLAAAGAALGPPLEALPAVRRQWVGGGVVALVPLLALAVYGWPSVHKARAALDALAVRHSDDVMAHRCTHVSGDYWDVWPAVFRANLLLYERGEARVVWGLAERGEAAWPKWRAVPTGEVRMGWLLPAGCSQPAPENSGLWRGTFPELRAAERTPNLWLYRAPE